MIIFDAGVILSSKPADFIGTRNIEVLISFLVYIFILLFFDLRFINALVMTPIMLITWNLSNIGERLWDRLLLFFLFPPLISSSSHDTRQVLAVAVAIIDTTYAAPTLMTLNVWTTFLFLFFFLYIVNSMTWELRLLAYQIPSTLSISLSKKIIFTFDSPSYIDFRIVI